MSRFCNFSNCKSNKTNKFYCFKHQQLLSYELVENKWYDDNTNEYNINEFQEIKEDFTNEEIELVECNICMEDVKTNKIITLNCHDKHTLCIKCYSKLDKCPYCRSKIDFVKKTVSEDLPITMERLEGIIRGRIVDTLRTSNIDVGISNNFNDTDTTNINNFSNNNGDYGDSLPSFSVDYILDFEGYMVGVYVDYNNFIKYNTEGRTIINRRLIEVFSYHISEEIKKHYEIIIRNIFEKMRNLYYSGKNFDITYKIENVRPTGNRVRRHWLLPYEIFRDGSVRLNGYFIFMNFNDFYGHRQDYIEDYFKSLFDNLHKRKYVRYEVDEMILDSF